jgi:DNA-binding winged helix-turn-helix (wHTH) protein/TolB-like protein/tetratricopeptide (TPR) repeat protein
MAVKGNIEFSFGEFTLDPHRRHLLRGGKQIPLNARAFDLLHFLIENAGRIVPKEEILNSVWKGQFVEESNLAVQISAIRRALGDRTDDPQFLMTIPGKGYQFVAPVTPTYESRDKPDVTDAGSSSAIFNRADRDSRHLIAILAGIASLAVVAFFGYRAFIAPGPANVRSIAVVPFAGQMPDSPNGVLSEGLAESVIITLSRIQGIRVMSRESTFRYRGDIDPKRIGHELNVEAVLTGRFVQTGDSLSVRSELISTSDSSVVWTGQFTRKMVDMQLLQNDIGQSIARDLKVRLSGGDIASLENQQTADFRAYQLYLLGRFHLNQLTDDGFLKGRDAFRQAIEKDPSYALAHAGLADAYNLLCGWGAMAPNEGYPLAKASATRALELDDSLADAHVALGTAKLFYDVDWIGAERELQRAIDLNPSNADAQMMYGHELILLGRFDESRPPMSRAVELDPLSIVRIVSVGNVSYFERDLPTALEVYRRAVTMDPNSGLAHWSLGNALSASHQFDEAIVEFQKAIALSGDSPDEPAALGLAYALKGDESSAIRVIDDLSARSKRGFIPPTLTASIYGALGKRTEAFELLEHAFRERDSLLVYLKVDPMFDSLRADPRFDELQRRLGL